MPAAVALGRLLVSAGLVSQTALDDVLDAQKRDRRKLGELLVERGLVRGEQLAQVLSRQLSCPWVSLQRLELTPELAKLLPRELVLAQRVVPVHLRSVHGVRTLYVAMDDPTDDVALSECARAAEMRVKAMVALTNEVTDVLARYYGGPAPKDSVRPASKPKPPPPASTRPSVRPRMPSAPMIEESDLVPISEEAPQTARNPRVLALGAPEGFLAHCKSACETLRAELGSGPLENATVLAAECKPCAIVVTEETYAKDRPGISRLALDYDALLVVWSADVDKKQLEGLLEGAVTRWRRSSYEKGSLIDGRYELVRDLGGAFARSRWEVRHVRTGRRAVLRVGVRDGTDVSDADAVRREHEALEKIHHPSGVDLRDAGTTSNGDPYIVVELIEGKSLEALVAARGKLPPVDACAILRQAADLVGAAHEAGVAHGDLRSESIVVVRDPYGAERVKVIGWEHSSVHGDRLSVRKDITDLGTCAFEALLGRPYTIGEEVPSGELPEELTKLLRRALDGNDGTLDAKELIAMIDHATPRARERARLLDAARRESSRPEDGRRHKRAPYRTPVRIEVAGVGPVDGRTEDVSQGGVFIVTRADIGEGAEVTMRFALPVDGKIVSETGIVRWSRAAPGAAAADLRALGVELSSPGTETLRQIERYVALMGDPQTG